MPERSPSARLPHLRAPAPGRGGVRMTAGPVRSHRPP
ncbi:hypothetical protein SAMN05421681_104424 [Lysobacter enzymogenes]|nr:hypothetical protein SAMN05421681_104424 [Lysobacter enzymogenes]